MQKFKSVFSFLLLLTSLSLVSCLSYKDVQFKGVEDFNVKNFSQKEIVVEVSAKVNNPNSYNITIVDSDLDLFLNGTKMGKATIDSHIKLKKKTEQVYTFMVKANMSNIGSKVQALFPILLAKRAAVKINGSIKAKAMGARKSVPIDVSEQLSF